MQLSYSRGLSRPGALLLRRVLSRQVTCSAVCRTVVPLNLEGSAYLSTGMDLAVHFVLAEVFVTCAPAPLVSYVHIRRGRDRVRGRAIITCHVGRVYSTYVLRVFYVHERQLQYMHLLRMFHSLRRVVF